METMIKIRNKLLKVGYKTIARPIYFKIDPEKVHDKNIRLGSFLGSNPLTKSLARMLFSYSNKKLEQNILNINFKNPIGLAAGFDKDANLTDIISEIGFGFEEIGSITGKPCKGNPKPRLWRLKKSRAIVVNYGLKNKGCEVLSKELKDKKFELPILTSIAKTNSQETVEEQAGIKDYIKAHQAFAEIGDIAVINLSCPNTFGGQPFHDNKKLAKLLKEIKKVKTKKPILLKISPDLTNKQMENIISLAEK